MIVQGGKHVLSTFYKHHSPFHTHLHRSLSSNSTDSLHDYLQVLPTSASSDVFQQPVERLCNRTDGQNVFGGQMVGSVISAAQQTLSKTFVLHSLHLYFINAADRSSPIFYHVSRLRDGKSFVTRTVTAKQNDRIILESSMSFHRHEKGNMAHQPSLLQADTGKTFLYSRLDLPGPEELLSTEEYCQEILQDKRLTAQLKVNATQELQMLPGIDFRFCQPRNPVNPQPRWPARRYVWVKTNEPLPDDPQMHQSAIVYCSDRILLPTAYLPYALIGADSRIKLQTSLDYAVWFHDGFNYDQNDQSNPSEPIPRAADLPPLPKGGHARADDWLLYEIECPAQMNHRAWVYARIWNRHGRLVATCTQEGLIRSR